MLNVHTRVGTPHIKMCSDVQNRVGTPHIKMWLHVHTRVGTPHMPIGVSDQMFKLGWGHRTRSKMFETTNTIGRVGCAGYVVGGSVAQAMWWVGRLRRLCGNYSDNNATSWLHLASWNLPDSQLS